jgi:hypothetical protein
MKKMLIGVFAIGSALAGSPAVAGEIDNTVARLDALERENAAIRRENAALRENKTLLQQNPKLSAPVRAPKSSRRSEPAPALAAGAKRDPFGAYAADLPLMYKAPFAQQKGLLRLWGEGGAIWSGGDPVSSAYQLTDFTFGGLFFGGGGGGPAGVFDLTPKVGWEFATGFDYRFANSPWHVNGQFRYGEGGKTSGSASTAGSIDPAVLALLNGGGGGGGLQITGLGGSEALGTSYKEKHWIADIGVGRDMLGSGPDTMQLKGGLRIQEFVSRTSTTDVTNTFLTTSAPLPAPFPPVTSANSTTTTLTDVRTSFLGAGPRVGIEGSVPFAGKWSFDYLGDAAILFGTQKSATTQTANSVSNIGIFGGLFGGGSNFSNAFTNERFATVFSADIQVGVSYWITQNVKIGASYRLDAMINVQNQDNPAVTNLTPDRYTHGPRLTVTGQF